MKKNIFTKNLLLLLLFLPLFKANAQSQEPTTKIIEKISGDGIYYCELMGIGRFMSNKVTVTIDYGQETKFFSPEDQRIKDESTGRAQKFNSMIDAMNYMAENGWEFVNAYVVSIPNGLGSSRNVYHWLLKKKAK